MGHVRRASLHRFRDGEDADPGRRRGHRLRHRQRPAGLRVQPGLHRLRRQPVRGSRREDLQDHGRGDEDRRSGGRSQRLRRRPHPGGCRLARRLCRRVRPQRRRLGRDPADFGDHGPMRRRRRLFAGAHRLHRHGEGREPHVRHRTRRGQDGDARGDRPGGPGRRQRAHDQVGRGRPLLRQRRRSPALRPAAAQLPSLLQPGAAAGPAELQFDRPDRAVARHPDPREPERALRHEGADPQGRRRGAVLRDQAGLRRQHPHRLRAHQRPDGGRRRQSAAGPRRLPGHRRLDQGARASCASATASTSRS